jgi:hypothetical protein
MHDESQQALTQGLPNSQELAEILGGEVDRNGRILCPGPDHSGADRSLTVTIDPMAPDGFVVHSYAGDDWQRCKAYVLQSIASPSPRLRVAPHGGGSGNGSRLPLGPEIARYTYADAGGTPIYRVRRFEPPERGKVFIQQHWVPPCNIPGEARVGEWKGGCGTAPLVLYRLPEILSASEAGKLIFIVEGEKAADAMAARGLEATYSPMGAGKWPLGNYAQWLRGARVVILPDNDAVGRKHAGEVAASLLSVASEVHMCILPDLPEGGDAFDWFASGRGADDLQAALPLAVMFAGRPAVLPSGASPEPLPGQQRAEPLRPAIEDPDISRDPLAEVDDMLAEADIADAFVRLHHGRVRYVAAWNKWMIYKAGVWTSEGTLLAYDMIGEIIKVLAMTRPKASPHDIRTMKKSSTRNGVATIARADRKIAAVDSQWDLEMIVINIVNVFDDAFKRLRDYRSIESGWY